MRNFIGRTFYLKNLSHLWDAKKTRLISLYGRRRVGKTALIEHVAEDKKTFLFEALEGEETASQISHFLNQLSQMTGQTHIKDLRYKEWSPVFDLFTEILKKEKSLLVCFDELSWMAAGRTKLISTIKWYWDKQWKNHPHLLLILCGSVASWMVKNVVRSKALYGRISENILVEPLEPFEVSQFIGNKRGQKEILEFLLCFGGIPRYLEEFDFNQSLQLNIEQTCFRPSGFFKEEADKIFYNQFKETMKYQMIVNELLKGPRSLKEIASKISIPSGGGLKMYMDNLIAAGIVERISELQEFRAIKSGRYYLMDEYLRFYHWFIRPNLKEIEKAKHRHPFEKFTDKRWELFLGHAFEKFCLRHRYRIASLLGFENKVTDCGPFSSKGDKGFQYDLIFLRKDSVITFCEIKYLSEKPTTKLIQEFEQKLVRTKIPKNTTIERALICNEEPTQGLKESGYFHQILMAEKIVSHRYE